MSKSIAGGEQEYNKVQINELSKVIGIYEKRLCEAAQVEMLRFTQFNNILLLEYVNGKGRYWNSLKLDNNVEDIKKNIEKIICIRAACNFPNSCCFE